MPPLAVEEERVTEKRLCSLMDKLEEASTFLVKYVASFMVAGDDQEKRLNCVHVHLEAMRRAAHINVPISLDASAMAQLRFFQRALHNSKPVLLEMSASGIGVRSSDGQTAHMVHALKRVSYSTCDPDSCQFAFSARQPSSTSDASDGSKRPLSHPHPGVLYCHVFLTDSPQQAKEINDFVSGIFREAERGPRERHDTVYYEFQKNVSSSDQEEKSCSVGMSSSPPSLAFNGRDVNGEKVNELLERREEKRFSDLCQMLVHEQGQCQTIQYAKPHSPVANLGIVVTPESKYCLSHESAPVATSSCNDLDRSIGEPSPRQLQRSKYLGRINLDQSTGFDERRDEPADTDFFPEFEGSECSTGNDVNPSPLRPESKRQKRRPLSAVLTDFAGAGKRKTSSTIFANEDKSESMRRISMLDSVLESNKHGASKNGSILKRLLHLKIGSGSSLRLNLLNDCSVSAKSDQCNGHFSGSRQRSSQSVRFLGPNLDEGDDAVSSSNGIAVLSAVPKRKRRPLSAVFGNTTIYAPADQNGLNSSHAATNGSGLHGFGNGFGPAPAGVPFGTKKTGAARSAVSKMFGFSSSRRKSRSSAQLDTSTRRHITLSTDLDSLNSIFDGHDSALRRLAHQHQPSVDDVRHWQQQQSVHCLDETMLSINGGSPILGSGVGCGEQCSVSMPNLRCSIEQSLPLTLEEEMKLNGAAWFYGTVSRQLVAQVLENEPEGAFVVRRSVSQPLSSLVLSVRVPISHNPSGVSHYLVLHSAKGFKLKGFTKDFPSVHALVTHHSILAEQLPCRLVFTDREAHDNRFNRSIFNTSSYLSMSNVVLNDHHYQKRLSRHSSPFVNKRHDLVPVSEEESIYGKLPSPPPPPDQASSTIFAALKIADAKVF